MDFILDLKIVLNLADSGFACSNICPFLDISEKEMVASCLLFKEDLTLGLDKSFVPCWRCKHSFLKQKKNKLLKEI